MAVFKVWYTKDGHKLQTANFYAELRDHNGRARRVPGFADKRETEKLLGKLEALRDCKINDSKPGPELVRWIGSMDGAMRDRLADLGLLEASRQHVSRALGEHLGDWQRALIASGTSEKQARLVAHRAERVLAQADCKRLTDLESGKDAILQAVAEIAKADKLSVQTKKFLLAAVKQFVRWLVPDRIAADPLVKLEVNDTPEPVHERRALSHEEARDLLQATASAPERWGMTGPDRALLYRLALETGLRAAELRSLTRKSFDLEGDPPCVYLPGKATKNGKDTTQPLTPRLVEALGEHLRNKLPAAPAFNVPSSEHTAKMLRDDLKAAGIEYRDDSNRVADFHSLRHTFITNLARAGVHPSIAQQLARHSSITLTMNHYTHTKLADHAKAVNTLPDFAARPPKAKRA